MKKVILICLCLLSLRSEAQRAKITITFADTDRKETKVIKPVNGVSFPANYHNYKAGPAEKCVIDNDLTVPGQLQVNMGRAFLFFLEPKKNYSLHFHLNAPDGPFTFTGENAAGQYLFNKVAHADYQRKADNYLARDSSFKSIANVLSKDAAMELDDFKKLLAQKKITPLFYAFVQKENEYYYAAVLSAVIAKNTAKAEFVDAWAALFNAHSLNEPQALGTASYFDYLDQYAVWYKTGYLRQKAGTLKRFDIKRSNEYLLDWYSRYADNLQGKVREYMLARFLYRFMNQKKYELELVRLFGDFRTAYPNSVYITYLQPGVDEIISFHNNDQPKSEIKIIENYASVNSLDELTGIFKGKTIYVDIWATWCGPCKEEFAFSKDLIADLKTKNCSVLYISMDLPERDKEWREMMSYFGLTGSHIRASEILRQDLINKIWAGKGYSIPRYLIIKDGKIVENNALRPSDGKKLYDQIGKYL